MYVEFEAQMGAEAIRKLLETELAVSHGEGYITVQISVNGDEIEKTPT